MRKYFLLASALLALPAITSCGGPNGDPQHDAELFEDEFEKFCDVILETQERNVEYMEYYAENENMKAWREFQEETKKLEDNEYNDKIKDLNEKLEEIEKEMKKNAKDDDEDDE